MYNLQPSGFLKKARRLVLNFWEKPAFAPQAELRRGKEKIPDAMLCIRDSCLGF
jgi:hypothetical protein